MNDHPDSIQLDALALGDAVREATRVHVADCVVCTRYVEALRAELGAAEPPLPRAAVRPRPLRRLAFTAAPVLALAAGVLLFLRTPPPPPDGPVAAPRSSEVHFKGGLPMAVVRERAGVQTRFTDRVPVRAGDRLRIEVALDVARPTTAIVVDEHGESVVALPPGLLEPGTHYSDRAVRIDAHPAAGWVLAGDPEAVERARQSHDHAQVAAIPIEVEPP